MTLQHPVQTRSRPKLGRPTWEVAHLYPAQGDWTVRRYLDLDTNHLVEFDDGVLEFLPMPTEFHQCLMLFLYEALKRFVSKRGAGTVLTAPMKVRVDPKKFREPDVLFMFKANAQRRHNQYWDGADLVMEVVSPDDPRRYFEDKPDDYAAAGIPE
jgi:Uma2 family endonuclease